MITGVPPKAQAAAPAASAEIMQVKDAKGLPEQSFDAF
jgi:hypothetical protein